MIYETLDPISKMVCKRNYVCKTFQNNVLNKMTFAEQQEKLKFVSNTFFNPLLALKANAFIANLILLKKVTRESRSANFCSKIT